MPDSLKPLVLNYNSDEARAELQKTMTHLPSGVEVYLVGGTVRNALYREFHETILVQRDYDQVILKGSQEYGTYLTSRGYKERQYPSNQEEQVVFRKALNDQARHGDSYTNWLVFDMHTVDGTTIEDNFRNNVCFTINGCAIKGTDLFTKPQQEAIIEVIPAAIQDIKDKQLRVNPDGYKRVASNFYAMLRFMSAGFLAPSKDEINMLLRELPKLEHARFDRNVKKVWDYVGGEKHAREIVKSLGIDIDVFNEQEVKTKL